MAIIGSFGEVVFEVQEFRALTFNSFERKYASTWSEHDILNQKSKSEFGGVELEEINFNMILNGVRGVNPIAQINKLKSLLESGRNVPFVLGGKSISKNNWTVRSITEVDKQIDPHGNILFATLSVTIKEYVVDKTPVKKATVSSVTKKVTNPKSIGTMTVTAKSIHIRSGPSTSNKVLGYAMNGQKLEVQSVSNGWYSLGNGKYISANSKYSTFKEG